MRMRFFFATDKAVAAEQAMASIALKHVYSFKGLLSRNSYKAHQNEILAALREVNAGGHALELILGHKSGWYPTA